MSLRDRWRRRGPGPAAADAVDPADAAVPPGAAAAARAPAAGRTDVTDFDPRSDGEYHCAARGLYLRFARPAVMESDDAHADPARGEFTQSGRFVVQRRFGRAVVYTVLERRPGQLTVRRTDTSVTGGGGTAELRFTFEPDER